MGKGKALELFQQMQQEEGVQPDPVSFVGVLNACASVVALKEGRRAHEQIVQSRCESDVFVGSSLVDMYAKCGSMEDAARVFNKMPLRNVVLWNTMISGHVKCWQGHKVLELFGQMQQEHVQPDPVTLVVVLNACASVAALEEGRCAHEQIIHSRWDSDVYLDSSLVDMYAKCGSMEDARRVFNKMPSCDAVTWNMMISGLVKCGQGQKVLGLFQQMQQEGGQADPVTLVGVLNACAKCGSMEDACRVFNQMPSHDVVIWNVMIFGHVKCG